MAGYICDDPGIETCLKQLEAQVTAAGGWLHDALVIRERATELSLETSLPPDAHEMLIYIPEEILLSLDRVKVVLSNNDLSVANPAPEVSAANFAIFQTLFDLYNLTTKIKSHKQYSPWVTLANDQEVMRRILAGRSELDFAPSLLADIETGNIDALILKSFFKTRVLRLADDMNMLVPMVDCANHHNKAASFKYASDSLEVKNIGLLNSQTVPGSNETFIRYGTFDALDLYLNFGFSDARAGFVRSIPMTIPLGSLGALQVRSLIGAEYQGALPAELEAARVHVPQVIGKGSDMIDITHLMIPGDDNLGALKKILAAMIKGLAPNLGEPEIAKHIASAEAQLIKENVTFYKDLQSFLKGRKANPAIEAALAMTGHQLKILKNYN